MRNHRIGWGGRGLLAAVVTMILLVLGCVQAGEATILTFDQDLPNDPTNDFAPVPQVYGDSVPGSPQGGFTYGNGGEGFTPHVATAYGPGGNVRMWTAGYGDLTNVIYQQDDTPTGRTLDLTLTAAPGYDVRLYSFDMAGFGFTDRSINAVQVLDGASNTLFTCTSCFIDGTAGHTAFSFSTPLTSQVLRIHFDASNLGSGSDNIGLDNVRFGEQAAAVPEPASLVLVGAGFGLAAARLGRRRRRERSPAGLRRRDPASRSVPAGARSGTPPACSGASCRTP
jgi:hypothetical protein